ncbi:hypothetical protein [Kitasatospora sp. LaBMicrA B282]|uniref:hypothetical protein n=1 Tax=Kitasatospora sp. LaBMicrA B282 TaxID=3420949 RepID=UPI003D12AE8C
MKLFWKASGLGAAAAVVGGVLYALPALPAAAEAPGRPGSAGGAAVLLTGGGVHPGRELVGALLRHHGHRHRGHEQRAPQQQGQQQEHQQHGHEQQQPAPRAGR